MSRICPVLFVQNLSRIFSCSEYVWKKFLEFFMTRICSVYLSRNCPNFLYVRNMSRKFPWEIFHDQNLSSFLDMKKFRTAILRTFSGHKKYISDNFVDIF